MNEKCDKIIVRVDEQLQKSVRDMRSNYGINVSALIRSLLIDHYTTLKYKEKNSSSSSSYIGHEEV